MKKIEVGDTVYYKNDFYDVFKAKVLQLFTNYTDKGKPYPVALVVNTYDKAVRHAIVETQYLTHDSAEYAKNCKRNQIKEQINQLQMELREL